MILPFAVVLALRWAALLSKNTSSGTATLRKIASRTELLSLVLWLFLATLLFVALVLSRSRMGIISILVSLVAILALAGTASMPARTRVAVATLFFLGVLGLIVWIGIDPVMSRFETLGQEYNFSGQNRIAIWRDTLGLIRHHRSEEHTSELQSRLHLVCRLLLEKKKNNLAQRIQRVLLGV